MVDPERVGDDCGDCSTARFWKPIGESNNGAVTWKENPFAIHHDPRLYFPHAPSYEV